jgi:peroxiredoxin
MRRSLFAVVMLLALAGAAGADDVKKPQEPVPPQSAPAAPLSPSPQPSQIASQIYVGEPAPDFELDGSLGRPVRLAHLKGYWLLLVFAERRGELASLKGIEPDLRKLGVKPYGICADKAHVLRAFAERQALPFELLSDVTREISQLYGLHDSRLSLVRPGFVLIDRHGVVRMALLGQAVPFEEMLDLVRSAVTGS